MTEETRCWLCRRSESEVREFVKPILELREETEETVIIEMVKVIDYKVPVCMVCRELFRAMLYDALQGIIGGDPAEIVTTEDLEKLRISYK